MADVSYLVTAVQALGGTAVLVAGGVVTWRKAQKESKYTTEDRLDARMTRMDARLEGCLYRERIRDDYIQLLRQHISEEKPPPPPPWPKALTHQEGID